MLHAPVWSPNASDSSFKKIQTAQNAALRTATGAHKMVSIDYPHQESLTLKVKDHQDMLSAQYIVNYLEDEHVCHGIITQEPRPRPMKETLSIQLISNNRLVKERPPPISDEEQRLNRRQRCTLSQIRSGHCRITSIGCLANQATSVQTVDLHHKTRDTCSLATHTRRTCQQRIYGGSRWDQFVHMAPSTTETLTDLTTDLVVENNNNHNMKHKRKHNVKHNKKHNGENNEKQSENTKMCNYS